VVLVLHFRGILSPEKESMKRRERERGGTEEEKREGRYDVAS
jgi:hypothetical protein